MSSMVCNWITSKCSSFFNLPSWVPGLESTALLLPLKSNMKIEESDGDGRILPWEVFDTLNKGLFEGVAPDVVDDEVGGGVDDKAEVVHAGEAELPGCWA